MKFHVVECSPSLLRFDFDTYPDRDDSFIYDHLKYYCSKFASSSLLPSAHAKVSGDSLVIVSRHKYAQIAKDLAVPRIRVVVTEDTPRDCAHFLHRDDVAVVDFENITQEELMSSVHDAWHVSFFAAPLSKQQRNAFEDQLAGFFLRLDPTYLLDRDPHVSQLSLPCDYTCGEFLARTPAGDQSWIPGFWNTCQVFSERIATSVSYQGRRFNPNER